jgi:tellurite resistance protein
LAFTFGATALATAPLRIIEQGEAGAIALLAPYLFAGANLTVGVVALGTVMLFAQSLRRLPALPPASIPSADPAP